MKKELSQLTIRKFAGTHITGITFITLFFMAVPNIASSDPMQPIPKLQHMTITPSTESPQATTKNPSPEGAINTPEKPEQKSNMLNPLDAGEALKKSEELKPWGKHSLAATAKTEKEMVALLDELESNLGGIPPQGLFLSAQSLANAGRTEDAAVYFMVGQVRLEFDRMRWPALPDKSYLQGQKSNAKKSEGQTLPSGEAPNLQNPHAAVEALSANVSIPIFAELMKDTKKMALAINRAEKLDLSAPFAYDPGYEVEESIPHKEWSKILSRARTAYFSRMRNLNQALDKYKR